MGYSALLPCGHRGLRRIRRRGLLPQHPAADGSASSRLLARFQFVPHTSATLVRYLQRWQASGSPGSALLAALLGAEHHPAASACSLGNGMQHFLQSGYRIRCWAGADSVPRASHWGPFFLLRWLSSWRCGGSALSRGPRVWQRCPPPGTATTTSSR